MLTEKAKQLATSILTGSDRITKEIRQQALEVLSEVDREEETDVVTIHVGGDRMVKISHSDYRRYRDLIIEGKLLYAIKHARRIYKMSLLDAKRMTDTIRANLL